MTYLRTKALEWMSTGCQTCDPGNRITLNNEGLSVGTYTESEIEGNYFDENYRGDYITIDRVL